MCRKGEFKSLWYGATGEEGPKSSTRLIQPSCKHTIRRKLGKAGGEARDGARAAPADWVFWGLPFVFERKSEKLFN